MSRSIVSVAALLIACAAAAQPVASPAPALAPQAARTEPASYRSAFTDYRSWQEPEPVSWRAANESAAALGGHLGHVRGSVERIQAKPATPPPGEPGVAP